jgi:hypothetical protein
MSIFTKISNYLREHNEKVRRDLQRNNVKEIFHWWKKVRQSDLSGDYSREIARSPSSDRGSAVTQEISQTPVQPLAELEIARSPTKVEVLSPPIQVSPTQNPVPPQTIDVQPVAQELITKKSADKDKDFF